jgi:trimethylamine---corrinoid protein Co-methyltransferase
MEVGVKFYSEKALNLLKNNGAKIDAESGIAKIPEEMVTAALKAAPKSFVLGARNPEYDFPMPSPYSAYNLDGGGIYCIDFKTGKRRISLYQDNIEALKVFDEMDLGTIVWTCGTDDIPDGLSAARMSLESLKYTQKHLQEELLYPEEVPYLIEGLVALLGSEDEVKRRKIYSVVYCTIPPLKHDKEMSEAYMELGQFDVPICLLPMNAPGTSGPGSVFSTIAVANAENLSSLVLYQMANPGCTLIYGDANLATDFKTGNFLAGSPDMVLQTGALGEMARFYGLPNEQGGCLTDAKEPGAQAVMEKMLTTLPLVLSGVDVVQGLGSLDNSGTMCLEQIVVDHEIARQCERIRRGIAVTEDRSHFTEIAEQGPGGTFLGTESTVSACRSNEFFEADLIDRMNYDMWNADGRPGIYTKARDKVEEIIASPQKNPLSDDELGKLNDIIRRIETSDAKKK